MAKSRVKYLGAVAFALAGLFPVCAEASLFGASDEVLVRDNGNVATVGFLLEDREARGFNIISVQIAIDPSQFGNATILQERDASGHLIDSDIFGICTCGPGGAFALGFASDVDTQLAAFGSSPRTFPETAGGFDATLYLDPTLQAAGFTASFESDAPEPATLALFGAGLAGLGAMRRRKARRNA